MTMTPGLRKFLLTTHIAVSVGWIGSVAAFVALSLVALTSQNAELVRGAYLFMNIVCLYIVVPLSLAALLTGLIQSLGTQWGLLRHYWVLMKLVMTIFAIVILLFHQFSAMSTAAKLVLEAPAGTLPNSELGRLGFVLARASLLSIPLLLTITGLSVYKPWGLTGFGRESRKANTSWQGMKAIAAFVLVSLLVLALIVLHLTGHHPQH